MGRCTVREGSGSEVVKVFRLGLSYRKRKNRGQESAVSPASFLVSATPTTHASSAVLYLHHHRVERSMSHGVPQK